MKFPLCPACGKEGASTDTGWGLKCKGCWLEWHWTADEGVYGFVLPENRMNKNGGWTLVPSGCLPIIREERVSRKRSTV